MLTFNSVKRTEDTKMHHTKGDGAQTLTARLCDTGQRSISPTLRQPRESTQLPSMRHTGEKDKMNGRRKISEHMASATKGKKNKRGRVRYLLQLFPIEKCKERKKFPAA